VHTQNLWIVIGIAYLIVIFLSFYQKNVPVLPILLLSGIGTTVTGLNARYKPLILGGIVLLASSVLAIWITGKESLLLCGVAIFVGYFIPGMMLKKSE